MQRLSLGSEAAVAAYVGRQLDNFFPDGKLAQQFPLLEHAMPSALRRVQHCINAVRMWPHGEFDHLHSSQYCQFLYYLAHTVWRASGERALCNKLFGLNKALNGIDLFYEIEMPEVFFIGHSVGIVLAKATYGERLVLYQGCTVGKNHGVAPVLGNEVVMYPGSRVLGSSVLGDGTVLAQGVSVMSRQIPGRCLVFSGSNGELTLRPSRRDLQGDFFRQ